MISDLWESADQFAKALDKLVSTSMADASKIIRKGLYDVASDIIDTTPHDTGRARAGWILTRNEAPGDVPEKGHHTSFIGDRPSRKNISDVSHADLWVWWIVNNVEYIEALENGSSRQAPHGMVATALNDFALHIKKHTGGAWE